MVEANEIAGTIVVGIDYVLFGLIVILICMLAMQLVFDLDEETIAAQLQDAADALKEGLS